MKNQFDFNYLMQFGLFIIYLLRLGAAIGRTKKGNHRNPKKQPFNKLRFYILPKHYLFNLKELEYYPFEGNPVDFSQMY